MCDASDRQNIYKYPRSNIFTHPILKPRDLRGPLFEAKQIIQPIQVNIRYAHKYDKCPNLLIATIPTTTRLVVRNDEKGIKTPL